VEDGPHQEFVGQGPDQLEDEAALVPVEPQDGAEVGQGARALHLDGELRFQVEELLEDLPEDGGILDAGAGICGFACL